MKSYPKRPWYEMQQLRDQRKHNARQRNARRVSASFESRCKRGRRFQCSVVNQ